MQKWVLFFSLILTSAPTYLFPQTKWRENKEQALIIVDLQHDFLAGGSLAIPGADEAFCRYICALKNRARRDGLSVIATQDSHPKGHISFASTHQQKPFTTIISQYTKKTQQLWPDHCIIGTKGHKIAIPLVKEDIVIQKGVDKNYDSYSGFADDGGKETKLHEILQKRGIKFLHIVGLATDYCVYHTALDAIKRGYGVNIIESGCLGVSKEDSIAALNKLLELGAMITREPRDEKAKYKVEILDGGDRPIQSIKALRQVKKGLGLTEALKMVEDAPSVVAESIPVAEAKAMKELLEAAGAKVRLS